MASTQRNTVKYQLRVGRKVIQRGATTHISRSSVGHHTPLAGNRIPKTAPRATR
jgi:hypothetical protein